MLEKNQNSTVTTKVQAIFKKIYRTDVTSGEIYKKDDSEKFKT